MDRRSSRVIEILRETLLQAERTPELGPHDPGVIELKRLLERWLNEKTIAQESGISRNGREMPDVESRPLK